MYVGAVGKIFETQVTGNNFTWREFWVMNDTFYTKKNGEVVNTLEVLPFKLLRSNVQLIENLGIRIGTKVTVDYFIKGKFFKDKPWINLEVDKITINGFDDSAFELGTEAPKVPNTTPQAPKYNTPTPDSYSPLPVDDDLPF